MLVEDAPPQIVELVFAPNVLPEMIMLGVAIFILLMVIVSSLLK